MMLGSDWFDTPIFSILPDLLNEDDFVNHNLFPFGGSWGFFSRMRIGVGGQIGEDIDSKQ